MLSVRPDRPVDPITVAVLRAVDRVANELDLPYFVAGAVARDIVIAHVFGLDTGRATRDVDFAVAVESWDQYESVRTRFLKLEQFAADKRDAAHRFYYGHSSGIRYPVDVIPFRGVEQTAHTIAWPPEMKVMMSVAGYEEALATALIVQIEAGLLVRVASLPGLALLKLFAWMDRGHQDSKDALDLVTLFRRYADAGNLDRLYGDDSVTLEAVNFDMELAGPRLLGQDLRKIAAPDTLKKITELCANRRLSNRLVTHMAQGLRGADDSIAAAERLFEQFRAGLQGERQ